MPAGAGTDALRWRASAPQPAIGFYRFPLLQPHCPLPPGRTFSLDLNKGLGLRRFVAICSLGRAVILTICSRWEARVTIVPVSSFALKRVVAVLCQL